MNWSRIILLGWLLTWLGVASSFGQVAAQASKSEASLGNDVSIEIGYENQAKLGAWVPVWVSLSSQHLTGENVTVEVSAPDSDGIPVIYSPQQQPEEEYDKEPTQPHAQESFNRRLLFLIQIGQADGDVTVRVKKDGQALVSKPFPFSKSADNKTLRTFPSTSHWILVVGPPIPAMSQLQKADIDYRVATHVANVTDIHSLPSLAAGYDGLDAIVLSAGSATSPLAKLSLQQRDALLAWVGSGGALYFFTSGEAKPLLEENALLAPFLPGRFERVVTRNHARAIETFCKGQYAFSTRHKHEWHIPVLSHIHGKRILSDGNRQTGLPLIVKENRGLGTITYLGYDPSAEPLASWNGTPYLLKQLIPVIAEEEVHSILKATSGLSTLGYQDLAGQLRAALDSYDGVANVPFLLITLLAITYLAVIGPLDYYLVHKKLKRPALTWITLPVWVLLFSLFAWWLPRQYKGATQHANQIELLDIDTRTGNLHAKAWASLYMPAQQTIDLKTSVQIPSDNKIDGLELQTGWFGLPGDSLGGMWGVNSKVRGEPAYTIVPQGKGFRGLVFAKWSSKSLETTWTATIQKSLSANLRDDGDKLLSGTLTNQFGIDLLDTQLFHGRWAWSLGDFAQGTTIDLAEAQKPITARSLLRKISIDDYSTGTGKEYDPASNDLRSIMESMMWYKTIGGASHVRLFNQKYSNLDMSDRLEAGQAILVAYSNDRVTRFSTGNKALAQENDRHVVVYRFILPVQLKEANPE